MDSELETIKNTMDGSPSRLGVDCIDLYYQHRIDPKVGPAVVAEQMQSAQ